jgi:hypothetical protein
MEKFGSRIRNGKKFGSGSNIPDPQHCGIVSYAAANLTVIFPLIPSWNNLNKGFLLQGRRT